MRFVGLRGGYVAGWLPGDTVVAAPVLDDGCALRTVPVAEWFRRELGSRRARWGGYGLLTLVPLVGAHSVWLFWHDDGTFANWYVNLERPHVWHAGGCDTRDDLLDLVCDTPRRWSWKDEDEVEVAIAEGAMTLAHAREIRAEGERLASVIEAWGSPFGDGWENWRPDPGWPVPTLPDDWADQ